MHIHPAVPQSGDDDAMFVSIGHTSLALPDVPTPLRNIDTFDDVFGSDDGQDALSNPSGIARRADDHNHPSDIRRLQGEHTTAGYREGVTVAKAASVQSGFDEGFGLGAALGLRAGEVVGVLEGLAAAVPGDERLTKLLGQASEDLAPQSVFGAAYWAADGNWTYPVSGQDGDDVLFKDVVEAHPLIMKWRVVMDEQSQFWGVKKDWFAQNQGVDDDEVVGGERSKKVPVAPKAAATNTAPAVQSRMSDALQW